MLSCSVCANDQLPALCSLLLWRRAFCIPNDSCTPHVCISSGTHTPYHKLLSNVERACAGGHTKQSVSSARPDSSSKRQISTLLSCPFPLPLASAVHSSLAFPSPSVLFLWTAVQPSMAWGLKSQPKCGKSYRFKSYLTLLKEFQETTVSFCFSVFICLPLSLSLFDSLCLCLCLSPTLAIRRSQSLES